MAEFFLYFWAFVNLLLLTHVAQELILMFNSFRTKKNKGPIAVTTELPQVTIQLPLFNEKYVVERLLENIAKLDYPQDKLEVQILDDSNDETSDIIQDFLETRPELHHFHHIRRPNREGYKAGALAYGMKICKGEFIAIFDADFLPDPQFLQLTLPHFSDEQVGVVQTRWKHINERHSLLTRAQAIMLNAHFGIEQLGRSRAGGFINFNGTAGVWRKTCITDSGGWHADTLTEDLDLSFRAQSKGWKFEYLFDVGSPAELPVTFEAFRTQQFRWSKGAAECLRKNAKLLWHSSASFGSKIIGTFHLMNSSVYILVVALLFLSPLNYYFQATGDFNSPTQLLILSLGSIVFFLLILIFLVGHLNSSDRKLKSLLLFIPSLFTYFAMTTGISLYMTYGVLEAYFGKKSEFIRTPKFGDKQLEKKVAKGYDFKKENSIRLLEFICLMYGLFWLVISFFDFSVLVLIYAMILLTGFSLSLFLKRKTFRWSAA